MVKKLANNLILLMLLVTTLTSCLGILVGCKKEEAIPWWEDGCNLEFIIEDERSEEKSLSYNHNDGGIYLNYVCDHEQIKEYIPTVRILHNGIEQTFYTRIRKRERYNSFLDSYFQAVILNESGTYRVNLHFFQNKTEAEKTDGKVLSGLTLNIIIREER